MLITAKRLRLKLIGLFDAGIGHQRKRPVKKKENRMQNKCLGDYVSLSHSAEPHRKKGRCRRSRRLNGYSVTQKRSRLQNELGLSDEFIVDGLG